MRKKDEELTINAELDEKQDEVLSSIKWPKALFTNEFMTVIGIGLGNLHLRCDRGSS